MDLEKLKQEAETLQNLDTSTLTPEQLTELLEKLNFLLDQSEQSLLTSFPLNETEIEENDETDNL